MLRVQWIGEFRHGLLADGKYRSALLQDRDGRLNHRLNIELNHRSRYVHQHSIKLLYPASLAWDIALPSHGARRYVF